MDDIELKQAIERRIGTSRIIWFALFSSVLIYAGLGYFLQKMAGFAPSPNELPPIVGWFLMLAGLSSAVVGALTASWAIKFPRVAGDTFESRFGSAQAGLIVSWALCESAALFGLVVFFLYRSFSDLIVMVAISTVGLVGSFPTESKFLERLHDRAP